MKKMGFYYVYDVINEVAITTVICMPNNLTAAIGFRDTYIKKNNSGINYKQLQLIKFANCDVTENGMFDKTERDDFTLKGNEIMDFISSELQKRGIEDNFVEDEKEGV